MDVYVDKVTVEIHVHFVDTTDLKNDIREIVTAVINDPEGKIMTQLDQVAEDVKEIKEDEAAESEVLTTLTNTVGALVTEVTLLRAQVAGQGNVPQAVLDDLAEAKQRSDVNLQRLKTVTDAAVAATSSPSPDPAPTPAPQPTEGGEVTQ